MLCLKVIGETSIGQLGGKCRPSIIKCIYLQQRSIADLYRLVNLKVAVVDLYFN